MVDGLDSTLPLSCSAIKQPTEQVPLMFDLVTLEMKGALALITLNRPQQRNAISEGLLRELNDVLDRLPSETRAIVLAGNGPCNQERLAARNKAHTDGAWVREAAAAYAEKHRAIAA